MLSLAATPAMATTSGVQTTKAIRDCGPYSGRNTSMGALIDEAARVFGALAAGVHLDEAKAQALSGSLLGQRSRMSRKRIWVSLNHRYFAHEVAWARQALLDARALDPHGAEFVSLLYLHYALRDHLTFDFVTQVLWARGHQSRPLISPHEVLDLLDAAALEQPQIDRWSEQSRTKLASCILSALRDFGVLQGKRKKIVVRPPLPLPTAEQVLRIITVEGCRGRNALENPTWRLFLLSAAEVADTLAKLAQCGRIRFEKVGSTVVLETPGEWEATT